MKRSDIHIKKADGEMPSGFECRKQDFADYLVYNAPYDLQQRMGQLYLAIYKDRVVGYMMLAANRLDEDMQKKLGIDAYGHIPALLISLLAVDKRYEGQGIGSFMVQYAQILAADVATDIGCRVVLVNSEPDVVGFYKKLKFVEMRREGDHVDMYLDLGTAPLNLTITEPSSQGPDSRSRVEDPY